MRRLRSTLPPLTAAVMLALGACDGDEPDGDRLDPDGETVIDMEIDDDTVITDPGGISNQLDGNDGDIEDSGRLDDD